MPWRYTTGSRWIGALILNLGAIWRWEISRRGCFIPGKYSRYQLNRRLGTLEKRKSLAPTKIWTSDLADRSLVAIPTTLPWMLLEQLSHLCNISHGKWGKTVPVITKHRSVMGGRKALRILSLGPRWRRVQLWLHERIPGTLWIVAELAPETAWTCWRRGKSLFLQGI